MLLYLGFDQHPVPFLYPFYAEFSADFADFHGLLLHNLDEAVIVQCFRYLPLYSHMSIDFSIVAFTGHTFDLDEVIVPTVCAFRIFV